LGEPVWRATNRAHWDEKVALHLGPRGYDLTSLRAGHGRFNAIEEAELWPVAGSRILHLQCHFGADSLKLARCHGRRAGLLRTGNRGDAVRCAVAVQQPMPERNTGTAADSRIELRIGINLGDVIVEGDDLYGAERYYPSGRVGRSVLAQSQAPRADYVRPAPGNG
jgi:hypothetical protein